MTPTEEIHQNSKEFDRLKAQGSLTESACLTFARRAAELTIEHFEAEGRLLREAIDLLCRLATSEDRQAARAGIQGLFPELIERLNDSFNPAYCRLYDQLFAQVTEFCRRLPEANRLNEALIRFGLHNEDDLLRRKSQIPNLNSQLPNLASFNSVKKVLLPSRVTIGADVAVTSVLIAKLRRALPQAEFVILGSPKLRELYGGDSRIRIREIAYERGGTLLSRLMSWLKVVEVVRDEQRNLQEDELWIVDPDSRLTQLGLLPLVENDRNYFFFESRSYQAASATSIGQLAAHWAGELIGDTEPVYPFVALPKEHQEFGQAVANQIRNFVTVSFGVGGNERKRVSEEFEEELIVRLSADAKLILDKGASREEREQINRIVNAMRAEGKTVIELDESNKAELINEDLQQADIVTWDGGIGAFAGLAAAGNQYIGYDSAGQHIAAALGVPTLTFFVNANNAAFAERWRPTGVGRIEVVKVDATQLAAPLKLSDLILTQVPAAHGRLKAGD